MAAPGATHFGGGKEPARGNDVRVDGVDKGAGESLSSRSTAKRRCTLGMVRERKLEGVLEHWYRVSPALTEWLKQLRVLFATYRCLSCPCPCPCALSPSALLVSPVCRERRKIKREGEGGEGFKACRIQHARCIWHELHCLPRHSARAG
jgi:hypothetical protein